MAHFDCLLYCAIEILLLTYLLICSLVLHNEAVASVYSVDVSCHARLVGGDAGRDTVEHTNIIRRGGYGAPTHRSRPNLIYGLGGAAR